MKKTELWFLAQTWVKSNHVLIWCIAAPYYKNMSCDEQDLENEALLTAYQVMSGLMRNNKKLLLMSKYYRVVFRTRCIKMTTGVVVTNCDIDQMPVLDQGKQQEPDQEVIREALQVLTNRQRQISQWILSQPKPVSISTVAKKFGVQGRTIRAILNNAIDRIKEYGHQPIREAITTAS